ncbi:AglZ/HisF2 family acetamidino modification protein [Flavobacteriaceae bacterium]|nr:AglZ/HisF2 family acetamidino modification protein [Flavobacteriaceae bacterium]
MLQTRVIPVLSFKDDGSGIIKTQKFKNPTYLGDVLNAVKIFNEKEVDELVILDIYATKQNREPNFERIKMVATECFMPLSYGGGITTLNHIEKAFNQGIEKVIICSEASNINLIKEASRIYGSQSIAVCVDIKKNLFGKYRAYKESGTKVINSSVSDYIQSLIINGAGEVILHFISNDGQMTGYDLDFLRQISNLIEIPIVVLGGAGDLQDFKLAVENGASAVAAGSLFVFKGKHRGVLINYPTQTILEKLFN